MWGDKMSLYYVLNEDEYKGNKYEIGDIMLRFIQELYKETGLSLNPYYGLTSEDAINYYAKENIQTLLEDVMWKNLKQSEKIDILSKYLKEIEAENGDLIIIDPYLFPEKFDDSYTDFIAGVLNSVKLSTIQFITVERNHNESLYNNVKDNCNCKNIKICFTDDYHDRLWIANKNKGFIMGTSLNGIGKKISLIDFIREEDLRDIVKDLDKFIKS
jgi:hypothetical protein